jgi:hypothetical protein
MNIALIWLPLLVILELCAPCVTVKDGNIFFVGRDGRSVQLTAGGLDCDPNLSTDNLKVVFATTNIGFMTRLGAA